MLPWEEAAQQQAPQPAQMMPWEEAAQVQAQSQGSAPLGQRIQNDWQQRAQAVKNAPDLPDFLISSARLGIGGAADVGNEVVKSAWNEIPGHGLVSDAAEWAKDKIASIPTMGGQATFGDVGNAALGAAQREAQAHPTLANAAGLAGDYGNLAALAGGASALREGVNAASDAASIGKSAAERPQINFGISEHLDNEASKAYKDAAGASRTETAVNQFIQDAMQKGSQPAEMLAAQGQDSGQKYLENKIVPFANKPMSIATAQDLDQQLRTMITKAYNKGSESYDPDLGTRYKAIRQALRDNIFDNPDESTLTGNPNAFDALKQGNNLFSSARKAQQMENMVQNGLETAVPSTGIQTQFRTLARQIRKKGPMGFKPNEVAAINEAAKSGVIAPTLRLMGSRLVTPLVMAGAGAAGFGDLGGMGGLVGGLIGEAGGNAAGAPFRAAATALQKARALKALQSVVGATEYVPKNIPSPILESSPLMADSIIKPVKLDDDVYFDPAKSARQNLQDIPPEKFEKNQIPMLDAFEDYSNKTENAVNNILQKNGYEISASNKSRQSPSRYWYIRKINADVMDDDEAKVRFSDHGDNHGGNDLNVFWGEPPSSIAAQILKKIK